MLVEYTAVPDALSATDANDVPILPENYHQAIELFALYLGYKYEEESKEAYYALSNFTAFMQTTRSPSDFEDEYTTKRYRVDTGRI
jgi:hypothetical protein